MASASPKLGPDPSFASPRSSGSSSHRSGLPLTPVYELDKMVSEMVMTGTEEVDDDEVEETRRPSPANGAPSSSKARLGLPTLNVPPPSFGNYSFGLSTSPSSSSSSIDRQISPGPLIPLTPGDDEIALPQAGFSFGTCPSVAFLGTPTAEHGPFQYPEPLSSSSMSSGRPSSPPPGSPKLAGRRESLALGMTHRRGSIVAHPHTSMSASSTISPPATRRSSTCSTILTLPVAGRRPSIIHSATIETSIPLAESFPPPLPEITSPSSAGSSRRGSTLMFPQKPMAAPIPPSLLARRGSLPVSQLFGLPLGDQHGLAGRMMQNGYSPTSPHLTTAASLYNRRQSATSESGGSSGSGATVMDGDIVRRGSMMRPTTPQHEYSFAPSPNTSAGPGFGAAGRRGSVSFFPPQQPAHNLPQRSTSLSARGTVASAGSARRSVPSRVPINFSPRHPGYAAGPQPHSRQPTGATNSPFCPSSPRVGHASSADRNGSIGRRGRHRTSGSLTTSHSTSELSSSEESNEDERDEQLPTPSQSSLSVSVESVATGAPLLVDPWFYPTALTENDGMQKRESELNAGPQGYIPLDTPPLETVSERPPLETVDSGKTERP